MPETRVTRNEQQILWHFKTCNNSCAFDARFLCRFFYYRVINQMKIYVSYEILPRERGATARRTRSRRKKGSETAELGKADHFNVAFRSWQRLEVAFFLPRQTTQLIIMNNSEWRREMHRNLALVQLHYSTCWRISLGTLARHEHEVSVSLNLGFNVDFCHPHSGAECHTSSLAMFALIQSRSTPLTLSPAKCTEWLSLHALSMSLKR